MEELLAKLPADPAVLAGEYIGFLRYALPVLAVLLLTGLAAAIHGLLHRQPMRRHIPLCTYAAPAYLAACTVQIILFGGTL